MCDITLRRALGSSDGSQPISVAALQMTLPIEQASYPPLHTVRAPYSIQEARGSLERQGEGKERKKKE